MLRNLLYSIFFHLMFVALLYLSTTENESPRQQPIKFDVTPLTINFISENKIENINQIKTSKQDERVRNLTLDQKIDLYNKIKNQKLIKENVKNYQKSTKKNNIRKQYIETEDNEFSYYYTPVYVAESKINSKEKERLIRNQLKKEELRKKMKETNIQPKKPNFLDVDINDKTIEEMIKISQKNIVIPKDSKKKKIPPIKKQNNYDEEYENINVNDVITEISMEENKIDSKYEGIQEDQIFDESDYQKLKELDETKVDTKYMLSIREKRNIQRQIKSCYKMAILRSKKDSKSVVSLTINVRRDGTINMNNIISNKDSDNSNKKDFNIAFDNAKSALVFCSPLRNLPAGKYKYWKQMTFVFDSNNLE